jgi:hypothetical protein
MTDFDLGATRSLFASSQALKPVAEGVAQLVELWPLEDAARIDNDVKYGEELQVRVTREIASRLLPNEDVTIADAEYVYEGGVEEIPGRPVEIAKVLLDANDAYDDVSDFSEDRDTAHVTAIGSTLELAWNDADVAHLSAIVEEATGSAGESREKGESAAEVGGIIDRLALSAAAYAGVLALGEDFTPAALLFVNELNEIQGLPRLFVEVATADRLRVLAQEIIKGSVAAAEEFIGSYSELARKECAKHREDVLWDPAAAKKAAKEADEAKNKAALAAKFAHVDNDAGKEHVEL